MDKEYYNTVIKPLLDNSDVEFIGEIGEKEKTEFLGNALALLFPIDWPEPFGLVMIEAMACGTPIIARLHGSVPEVVDHGVTGYIVKNVQETVNAIKNISGISRKKCREVFEQRFTVKTMAKNYLNTYERVIQEKYANSIK